MPSLFAQALNRLFDETGLFTRAQWARFLGVPVSSILEWISDQSIPRADLLFKIVDMLRNTARVPKEVSDEFESLIHRPSVEISPLAVHIGLTLADYMNEDFKDLGRRLRGLSSSEQQRILIKGCVS